MQPLISLLLALTHLLMERRASDIAIYSEELAPDPNLEHINETDRLEADMRSLKITPTPVVLGEMRFRTESGGRTRPVANA